jgi:hypothetical protein
MTTTTHARRPIPSRAPVLPHTPVPSIGPTHLRLVRAGEAAPVRMTARRPATEPPLRLTRRGRVALRTLVLLLLVALLSTAGLALARRADAAADPLAPVRYHVVLPGETLWGIATELDRSADPRATIAELVETNHLSSAAVGAGQRLMIPPGLPRHP